MGKRDNAYQRVFKATSLFGGVEILLIFISLFRNKVVALFLGPERMGVYRLLRSTVQIVGKITYLGLPRSAVKFIANEFAEGHPRKVYRLIAVLRKLLWATGVLGAVLLMILSPVLSQMLFATRGYTFSLLLLAVAVLFNQLANGRISILQSLRKLRPLAQVNLYGSILYQNDKLICPFFL